MADELTLHSSATPRARRHDRNLHRILGVAMDMVAAGGLDALSVHKLAEAVDYTPGALYRYVGSKDALLARLVAQILADVRQHLDAAVAALSSRASSLARVFALAKGYRSFALREPHRFGLLAMTMAEPRVLLTAAEDAEPIAGLAVAAMAPLAAALEAATREGQLPAGNVPERALCLFALLQGLLQMHKQSRLAPELIDTGRLVVRGTRALVVGWGARPRAVDAAIARVAALGDHPASFPGAIQ